MSLNMLLEFSLREITQEKEIQGIIKGKDVKLSLFAGDLILYLKDLKGSTRKLLDVINTFGAIIRIRKSTYKNQYFFYIPITS